MHFSLGKNQFSLLFKVSTPICNWIMLFNPIKVETNFQSETRLVKIVFYGWTASVENDVWTIWIHFCVNKKHFYEFTFLYNLTFSCSKMCSSFYWSVSSLDESRHITWLSGAWFSVKQFTSTSSWEEECHPYWFLTTSSLLNTASWSFFLCWVWTHAGISSCVIDWWNSYCIC